MRKIIQICAVTKLFYGALFSLCDDGTVWIMEKEGEWKRVNSICEDDAATRHSSSAGTQEEKR